MSQLNADELDQEIEFIKNHDFLSFQEKQQKIAALKDAKRELALAVPSDMSPAEIYQNSEDLTT